MSRHNLIEVVKLSAEYLGTHGSESPRLDAELLAAHALGIARLDLYLQHDRPLDDDELAAIRELVRRRGGGEPVAYLLGNREFYGRSFAVTPAVLIPRPETELLIEVITAALADVATPRLLDLGTGSGCIALTLAAELPAAAVVATDISEAALAVARENAVRLGVDDRVELRAGSWGEPVRAGETFDVVVSNPPYVTEAELPGLMRDVRDHEPGVALADAGDGVESYRQVFAVAAAHLAEGGLVAVEVDPRRAATVAAMARAQWPERAVEVLRDLAGSDRVVRVGV